MPLCRPTTPPLPSGQRTASTRTGQIRLTLRFGCWLICLFSVATAAGQDQAVSFRTIRFAPIAAPPAAALEYWRTLLSEVPGQRLSLQAAQSRTDPGCRLNGLARLNVNWTDDTLLRLLLRPQQRFCIHLFHEDQGVSLLYNTGERGWTGYVTTREPNKTRPERLFLAATDNGRARHSEFGELVPIGLHHHNGALVLTRGDLVLLGIPFAKLPTEIYLDGRVELRQVETQRCTDLPAANMQLAQAPQTAKPVVPTSLDWKHRETPGATFSVLENGTVRLSADRAEGAGWVTAPIPSGLPGTIIVKLDQVSPGTGLFVTADDTAQPRSVIHFVLNRRGGGTCVVLSDNAQWHERSWNAFPATVVPCVGESVWVRLVFGAGVLRWWVSVDGIHWAEGERPVGPLMPRCDRIGLYHVSRIPNCHIELSHLEVRPLARLPALCDSELRPLALAVSDSLPLDKHLAAWQDAVNQHKPPTVDQGAWTRACAIAAFETGCSSQLGAPLLNQLLDDALFKNGPASRWPIAHQLELLNEIGLLADHRQLAAIGPDLPARYFQLGHSSWRRNGHRPMSTIRKPLMESPSDRNVNYTWPVDGVLRDEILDLVYQKQWADLRQLCQELNFFGLHRYDRLVVWADGIAAKGLDLERQIQGRRAPPIAWKGLLSEQLGLGVYNQMVELELSLQTGAWEEAARHIAQSMAVEQPGVAPASHDASLLLSFTAVVRVALTRHPELVKQLEADFGDLLQLRVERAIQARQLRKVARLAEQFPGLQASQHATTWLADQLLARGDSARAAQLYERALAGNVTGDSIGHTDDLRARLRIAAALSGRSLELPMVDAAQLGSVTMTPEQVTSLTQDLLQDSGASPGSAEPVRPTPVRPTPVRPTLFRATSLRCGPRSPLQLAIGKEPNKEVLSGMDRERVDWPGRQLAVVSHENTLLVHNRFELVAIDRDTSKQLWSSHPMGDKTMRARDWPLIPMAPLVLRERAVARHLSAEAPELACWDLESGTLQWTTGSAQQIPISDPFTLDRQLAVFTLDQQRAVESVLYLQFLDETTGQPKDRYPLLRLLDGWWQRSSCQVLAGPDRVYVVLGGLSFSCDGAGHVHWIRTTPTTPPVADPTWMGQIHQPPLLAADTLVLAQVGVRAVEAVVPETGVLHWRTILPRCQQVIGIAGNSVIVKSHNGITALDLRTGSIRWQHDDTNLLLGAFCDKQGGIVYTRAEPGSERDKKLTVQVVRLDARTGQPRDHFMLDELTGSQPNVGPIYADTERAWLFFSAGALGGQRDMVELFVEENEQ